MILRLAYFPIFHVPNLSPLFVGKLNQPSAVGGLSSPLGYSWAPSDLGVPLPRITCKGLWLWILNAMILCDASWESPAPGVRAGLDPKSLPLLWREEQSGFSWDLCEYFFYLWFWGSMFVELCFRSTYYQCWSNFLFCTWLRGLGFWYIS